MQIPDVDRGDAAGAATVVIVAGGAVAAASQSGNVGPYLTFAGAILVALITAWTTNRRQRKQLEAEDRRLGTQLADGRERLRQELRAEKERLELQSDNERQLRDLDQVRALLDEVAAAYVRMVDLLVVAYGNREAGQHDAEEVPTAGSGTALVALRALQFRFILRFFPDHPFVASLGKTINGLSAMRGAVTTERWTESTRRAWAEAREAATTEWGNFSSTAIRLAGPGATELFSQPTTTSDLGGSGPP